MPYTRRHFGKLALASLPAAAFGGRATVPGGALQPKPNSLINGVQVGAITYSFRSMPDQSAEATLRYVVESGISAIELMGGPVESFAGAPAAPASGRGGGAGAPGRGRQGMTQPPQGGTRPMGSWNGQPCEIPTGRGGGGGGRPATTPERQAAEHEHASRLKAWRTGVSMEPFRKLRKMYNDAGVSIYAWKQLNTNMSDDELEYVFNVAEALGCTHTTVELPTDPAQLKRLGDLAMKKKIYAAYHTHTQGSMTAFDAAFAASKGNMANVDFGHWIAAANPGGTPAQFLEKYHDRIASFHLKDRTKPEHCALNLPWGTGETPIKEILQLVKARGWKMPASIELEYEIPSGSDAVREVRRCVDYCRGALTAT